ncbi:MAG: hypothetical protein AAF081_19765, partial [Actinomycetota bacterium]
MSIELDWLSGRMLGLQGPDRPWTILLGIRLHTSVPRHRVEDAWRQLCAHRPELTATLGDDLRWHLGAPTPTVVGPVEPELDRHLTVGVDPAVRVVVDADPVTTIRFVVNHALADGMGVRGMADDLLRVLTGHEPLDRDAVRDEHLDRLR